MMSGHTTINLLLESVMNLLTASIVAALSLSSFTTFAASPTDEIATKLNDVTGFVVKEISVNDAGLYEAVTDKGVFYVTQDGNHLINGQLHELADGLRNLTMIKKAELAAIEMDSLRDSFITYKATTSEELHELVVFFDLTCGYCQKLHNDIARYNALGVTIHYAMWPRQGVKERQRPDMYTQSFMNMQNIVCNENPLMALNTGMRGGDVPHNECENKIEAMYDLGNQLGVRGTPAIYNMEGMEVSRGYLPPADLVMNLSKQNRKSR